MGMLRDLLAVYGCVLGATLVVLGVLGSMLGLVFMFIGDFWSFIIVLAGVFFVFMGALVLYFILREHEPPVAMPPPSEREMVPPTPPQPGPALP